MRRLTVSEVHAGKVATLGLDPTTLDLTSVEAIGCVEEGRLLSMSLCPGDPCRGCVEEGRLLSMSLCPGDPCSRSCEAVARISKRH